MAQAECNPRDFIVKEIQDIQLTSETEIAFMLFATEEEYNVAKESIGVEGFSDIIKGSANYSEARERARRVAQATKFDYSSSYALNYFVQNLSPKALDAYVACLERDKEKPGIALWLHRREGDYFVFRGFWVGSNAELPVGDYDDEPKIDGGEIVSRPDKWIKAKTEEIVVRRDGNRDIFLRLKVGGQTKSQIIVKDPPPVILSTQAVYSDRVISTASFGPDPGCVAGEATDCIEPRNPSGYFVYGTATVSERETTYSAGYTEDFYINTPDRVCVKITQGTNACNVQYTAKGRLSAIERYPVSAQ